MVSPELVPLPFGKAPTIRMNIGDEARELAQYARSGRVPARRRIRPPRGHHAHGCGETSGWNTGTSMEFTFKQVPQVRDVVVGGWLSFLWNVGAPRGAA